MSKIEVEVYALSDLNTELRKVSNASHEARNDITQAYQAEQQRLDDLLQQREQDVEACEAALDACLSYMDEDGNLPDCSAESRALADAGAAFEELASHRKAFADQLASLLPRAESAHGAMTQTADRAREKLAVLIDTSLYYLRNHPEELGNVPHTGEHAGPYNRAKRELYRRIADGERGGGLGMQQFMTNELSNGFHSPTNMHMAHRVAGIDVPENLFPQYAVDNWRHYHQAVQQGLPSTYG